MSQHNPWGPPRRPQNTRLTPLSTTFAHEERSSNTSSPSGSRPAFSPATTNFPSLPPSSTRHGLIGSRSRKSSAASSTSTPFSPAQGQQPPAGQLLSSRTRTIAPQSASQLPSAAAVAASHGGGSNSGGGATRLVRASPSLSTSSTVGSPISAANSAHKQDLSRIVVAQVFLLLSQLSSVKDEKDRAKTEQIRKLLDSNGMEVFAKSFRRMLQTNAAHIFASGERNSGYALLAEEMQKLRTDADQAQKIAESIDSSEGDLFRDFDLAAFVAHFQLDPFAQGILAAACTSSSNPELRPKAESILSATTDDLLLAIARPDIPYNDGITADFIAALIERIFQNPPQDWSEEKKSNWAYAVQMRYSALHANVPVELESALQLVELTNGSQNPLVKLVQRAGPRAMESVEACKEMLSSVGTRDISYQQVAMALLFLAISSDYDAPNFVAALREHGAGQRLDWQDVVHAFDREGVRVTKPQFLVIYNALLPVAQSDDKFDIQLLWGGTWSAPLTQLCFLTRFLSCTPAELDVTQIPRLRVSYSLQTFEDAPENVKAVAEQAAKHPYVSLDATRALFGMIFQSSDSYHTAQVYGIPDTIINPYTSEFLTAAAAVPKPWGALQEQALKQLFSPYFYKKLANYEFVLYGLWQQDNQWLVNRFVDFYNAEPVSLNLILEHAQTHGWLDVLIRSNTDISLDLAAQAHARGLFNIEPWLQQTFEQAGSLFRRILANFLSARAADEMQRARDGREEHNLISMPLAVKTVYPLLEFLAACELPEQELLPLQRNCIQAYPRLINYGVGEHGEDRSEINAIIDANGQNGNSLPKEADEEMQEHFKKMYSDETKVRDIITLLRGYKESRDPGEQDLFACMIHGLFDEYNCFGEYPLEALATTAVLFGGIINFNLLPRIALAVGLAMVLESVQEYRSEEPMYKFGLQALVHFSERLGDWPNYCDQLLQIPGLQKTEIFTRAQQVVNAKVGHINGNGTGPESISGEFRLTNGNSINEPLEVEPIVPEFSCLHIDPPLQPELYEEPDEDVQDKVLFVLNNVSERNLHDKINELTEAVEDRHHQWFANYLVEERAKMQPNFQQLYLDMLEMFNDRLLWMEVLRETYLVIFRMLNSDGTLSSIDRTCLKNLGGWLGSLTIARDQPIKFRNISFKDLLIQGYKTNRLLLVIPFTCKVLAQASKSTVFRPPNPWLMEILRVLKELYEYADLKLNQKFEIEVLCKGLDIDHKTLDASDCIRTRPVAEEEYLAQMAPDTLEPFSEVGGIMSLSRARGPSERFSSAAITAALPDFASQLQYPPANNNMVPPQALEKIFLTAVQQAIQEIIAPVVERSVTIAAISTSQLVSKDFAMEPDEKKLRQAAHTVVKSLSGALALVTCKEPLRMSIQNNIRVMARDLPEQALAEGQVLMFVNDNLDLVCSTVEHAAEVSSQQEIDMQIEEAVRARRVFRQTRPNEPFKDAAISPWAFYIPEPYKQVATGLNREQMAIYEEFGRQSRSVPQTNNSSQDSGRQVPDVLQDQFAAVPNLPTPAAAPAEPRGPVQQPRLPASQAAPQQQLNGYMTHQGVDREKSVEDYLGHLMQLVKEAVEERISEVPNDNPIHEVYAQLLGAIEYAGHNKEPWAFRIAGQVTNHLFSEDLTRLEIETLAHLMNSLCRLSSTTSRQVLVWLATLHDDDRIFNATVMVALMEVGLMDMQRLNSTIAKAIQERRLAAVEMLSSLLDETLLSEHPSALRADFALSIDALTQWLTEDPDLEIGKSVITKLQIQTTEETLTPPSSSHKDQLEYIFDEWVHLQNPDTPKKSIAVFLYQLHKDNLMNGTEGSVQFMRTCIDAAIAAYEHAQYNAGALDTATIKIDALGKLIVDLVIYQGGENGAVKESKAKYLDQMLTVVILVLINHVTTRKEAFCQKGFARLFSTILFQLNDAVKDDVFAESKADIFLAVAKAFLALQPTNLPLFTFSWLHLISHRIFIPAMLEDSKDERWDVYAKLMETLLVFTGQLIRPTGETIPAQTFYRGVLRVLLVIHHDYPEFLAENHFRFCNSIPMHCTQLRNLIVSAYPSNILEMPDPFTAGLKVERLDDRQGPIIRADIDEILRQADIKDTLDGLLHATEPKASEIEKISNAVTLPEPKPAGFELVSTTTDPTLIHAIVLHIGATALDTQGSKGPIFDGSSSAANVMEKLVRELRPEARFHFISAIANQLRWPNSHTQYFSYALLHLFGPPDNDSLILDVQQTITRVLLERLLVHRPHPWGLIITLLEILKNRTYAFWDLPFVKAAPEVERLFNALFTHAQQSPQSLA
ncbi:Not1-domain-containing protein [Massarina eburnea CBS 473.64]|uniref:General negative regulator of transcription subunit 1 n=1 Tax=Massarina eburnea CBS 473.64 TaxID=1395130 RepID=A0A6A6SCP9_9PLEO|nr:Not1-domain-containing protein [Massarina eburnea CBS 473.64]